VGVGGENTHRDIFRGDRREGWRKNYFVSIARISGDPLTLARLRIPQLRLKSSAVIEFAREGSCGFDLSWLIYFHGSVDGSPRY
jgi:hypothetical protein